MINFIGTKCMHKVGITYYTYIDGASSVVRERILPPVVEKGTSAETYRLL
jgi:hypothetical protein